MLEWLVAEPNIVYLILVFGLWVAVTAAYVPGTGILELLALGALVVEIILLQSMPVSWAAVLLLVVGVLGFLLIPFLNQRWVRAAQGGLILQAIGGFFLFNGLQVSWALIALTVAISLAYHRLILMPLLTRLRQLPTVIGDNGQLIGTTGRVVKSFEPVGRMYVGIVQANGEQWTANSPKSLQTGDEIVVIEREGLQLSVEGIKYKHTVEEV
ncbi:MAG TPA: NfeD family protein [Phototrophicaceae bacterium]|nr:NfeD family protein [Phototrophicaceae bacterium]